MSWRNIRLIYFREIRDQLRDRRTLFMIAVLPMLLYPLLGMSVFQLSQFLRKSEPKVVVVGAEELKAAQELPALIDGDHFAGDLFGDENAAGWLHLEFAGNPAGDAKSDNAAKTSKTDSPTITGLDREQTLQSAKERLKTGEVQAVLIFPD